ncbi:PHD-like zinc-binding domain-containing protein, partial [Jimgerdemannia flammicorona]
MKISIRASQICYICKKKMGACIQCDNKSCFTAFHVTCGRKAKLYMKMKSHNPHYDSAVLRAYCDKHAPREYKEQVDVAASVAATQAAFEIGDNPSFIAESDTEEEETKAQPLSATRSSKAARAHQRHYTAGAPLAPAYILTKLEGIKVLKSLAHLRKKPQLVATICRYWSLKRESRRGAPLLKRLHLE